MNESLLDIRKQTADAERFITWFTGGACKDSTPHIYISALPFCLQSNSVYKNYWRQTQGLMHVLGTKMAQAGRKAVGTWVTGASTCCVTFSPDGTHIASGSDDQTIQVWDASTGEAVAGPFQSHTGYVNSVEFSSDHTHLASGPSSPVTNSDPIPCVSQVIPIFNIKHAFPIIVNFIFNANGWIIGDGIPLFWVAPEFQSHLSHPPSMLTIAQEGSLYVNYQSLMIGKDWTQCYIYNKKL